MNYETWMVHKAECLNDDTRPWCRLSEPAKSAMIEAHAAGAIIEVVCINGDWVAASTPLWHCGLPYRVSPTWPGPATPAQTPEYVDQPVVVADGYRFAQPGEDDAGWLISLATGLVGFAGYVYEADGKDIYLYGLVFDQQPDGTYRLRVPKAVRFLNGAKA